MKSGKWLKGPDFLKLPEEKWPSQNAISMSETDGDEHKDIDAIELKPLSVSLVIACTSEESLVIQLINYFSSLDRLKKATVWFLRFGQFLSAKSKGEQFKFLNHPNIRELELAEMSLIKFDQKKNLPVLYKALEKERTLTSSNCPNALWKGNPKMMNHAIVMVGRLANAPVAFCARHPLLLPAKTHLTKLTILQAHCACGHGGINHTFSTLRQRFWIHKECSSIRSAIRECLVCRKWTAKPLNQIIAELPAAKLQIY